MACSDSGAAGNENASADASTTLTTGGESSSGGLETSSSVTTSSNVTTTSSVTGSSVSSSTGVSGSTGSTSTSTATTGTTGLAGSGGMRGAGGTTATDGTSSGGIAGAGSMTGGGSAGSATTAGGGGTGGTSSTCPPVDSLMGGQQYCSNSKGNAGGGYAYELWASGSGSGCMTVYGVDANFGASWNNVEDFLARVGLDFDQTKTHAQIGTLSADFAETKTGEDGFLYVGIYGWTVNPLREYYILDDWGSTKPAGTSSDGTPRNHAGTITVDGATYDVWTKLRENKPAITGDNMTFEQYFSVRETPRQCGHISISEHFSQWEALGLSLGNLYEAKLLVEAQDNSGSVEFTTATVVVE